MAVPKSLTRKNKVKRMSNFGRIKFSSSPFASKMPVKPGSHLCDKHNTSDISISKTQEKRNMFLFSCAYACAYVACVMLIAQV